VCVCVCVCACACACAGGGLLVLCVIFIQMFISGICHGLWTPTWKKETRYVVVVV